MQVIQLTGGAREFTDPFTVAAPDGRNITGLNVRLALLAWDVQTVPADAEWWAPDAVTSAGNNLAVQVMIGPSHRPEPGLYQWWGSLDGADPPIPIFPISNGFLEIR